MDQKAEASVGTHSSLNLPKEVEVSAQPGGESERRNRIRGGSRAVDRHAIVCEPI